MKDAPNEKERMGSNQQLTGFSILSDIFSDKQSHLCCMMGEATLKQGRFPDVRLGLCCMNHYLIPEESFSPALVCPDVLYSTI